MSETKQMDPTLVKVLNIAKTVLSWILVAIAVFMMIFTLISVTMFDKDDRNFFGIKFYTVVSPSMTASGILPGDIVLVKEKSYEECCNLKVGDIVTFWSQEENVNITHEIIRVETNAEGAVKGYITKGSSNETEDATVLVPGAILGVYVGKISKLGNFFQYIKTTVGYIVCILIPFLLLIGIQAFDCIRLFRRYKAEQMANLQAEKDQIEKERLEIQSMMAQLMKMQTPGAAPAAEQSAPVGQPSPQDQQMPYGQQNSQTNTPYGQGQQYPPQGQMPYGQNMPGGNPYGQQGHQQYPPQGQMPYGQNMPGGNPYGQQGQYPPQGQMPYGQNMPGNNPYGQQGHQQYPPQGQMPYGQNMPGGNPYGQQGQYPPQGQMPYGQNMPGGNPYGQQGNQQYPPQGQMPYGQNAPTNAPTTNPQSMGGQAQPYAQNEPSAPAPQMQDAYGAQPMDAQENAVDIPTDMPSDQQ